MDKATEETTEVVAHTPTEIVPQGETMKIEGFKDRLELIDAVIKAGMKEGRDWAVIPHTKKPSLLKPGAEKLAQAFHLSATYETVDKVEDHHKEWSYEVRNWETKQMETKQTVGFFFYRVRSILTNRITGVVWADCEGTVSSRERGREDAPGNTILKMAQKRAYVGAMLNATASSDRFTQDMEDLPRGEASNLSDQDKKDGIIREMLSRYGEEDKKSKCAFCGQYHILKGVIIVQTAQGWGDKTCFFNAVQKDKPAVAPDKPDGQQEGEPGL